MQHHLKMVIDFVIQKADYRAMRNASDDLCRKYKLSVIEQPSQK